MRDGEESNVTFRRLLFVNMGRSREESEGKVGEIKRHDKKNEMFH